MREDGGGCSKRQDRVEKMGPEAWVGRVTYTELWRPRLQTWCSLSARAPHQCWHLSCWRHRSWLRCPQPGLPPGSTADTTHVMTQMQFVMEVEECHNLTCYNVSTWHVKLRHQTGSKQCSRSTVFGSAVFSKLLIYQSFTENTLCEDIFAQHVWYTYFVTLCLLSYTAHSKTSIQNHTTNTPNARQIPKEIQRHKICMYGQTSKSMQASGYLQG